MAYRHIFFDLDHTLWDFEANARLTLQQLHDELNLADRGVDDFERFHRQYLEHNERLWERYRQGFIKQEEIPFTDFIKTQTGSLYLQNAKGLNEVQQEKPTF